MDYNDRAKKSPYNLENEIFSFNEKIEEKLELRKKHNLNIIMAHRKKRILSSAQNEAENKGNYLVIDNKDLNNSQNDFLLNENDILLKLPSLNNINHNIKQILQYLSSDNIEEIKWIIHSLRLFFQNYNIPYEEYSVLFENEINKKFESLLKKYQHSNCIVNEILFIIANFYDNDEIVNKYPNKYFECFLNDDYFSIYENIILFQEEELVNSILILLRNILLEKKKLINYTFFNKQMILINLIEFIKDKSNVSIEIIKNFILLLSVIFQGIKNNNINDSDYFITILNTIIIIYKNIISQNQKNILIIKHILYVFKNAITCKVNDKNENDEYFVINYLFNGSNKHNQFIFYLFENILKDIKFYISDNSLIFILLDLLCEISYNANKYQINLLIDYRFLDILNIIFNKIENFKIIEKIIEASNNIINSGSDFAKYYVKSKVFNSLIKYYSMNMSNSKIVFYFLNMFKILLINNDIEIADNMKKRGIIKDGIFDTLKYCNNNKNSIEKEILFHKCDIISKYFQTVYNPNLENNGFDKEDYLLCYNFKEMLLLHQLDISDEYIEMLLHLDYMNCIENIND